MSFSRRLLVVILLLSVAVANPAVCESPKKKLLVVPMEDRTDSLFKKAFGDFTDGFAGQLARQLSTSRAVALNADPFRSTSLWKVRSDTVPRVLHLPDGIPKNYDYYLFGRLSDDMSNIAFVDGEVYERTADSITLRESASFHAEGSRFEAAERDMTLQDLLISQVFTKVEGGLDDRIRVLVTPFNFYGKNDEMEKMGGMIASFIGNRLSVSQKIRVIMRDTAFLQPQGSTLRSRGEYRSWSLPEQGRREAAKYVIGGAFYFLENSVGIEADEIDVATGHAVLSRSEVLDSLGGHSFYDKVTALGDQMRRAIELDDEINTGKTSITIAVVAVPPYPPTDENKAISVGVAETVARILKALSRDSVLNGRPIRVITDEQNLRQFVSQETENAIMGRDLNTQYLWVVRCERPARTFNIRFELSDVKNPQIPDVSVRTKDVALEDLNDTVHGMTREMLRMKSAMFGETSVASKEVLSEIELSVPENTFGVVPLPPYPNTQENRGISEDIANIVITKLEVVQHATNRIVVVKTDEMFNDFFDSGRLDTDSLARKVQARFLWLVEYKEVGHERYGVMRLVNATNPFDTVYSGYFSVGHIDRLNALVGDRTKKMLNGWWKELGSLHVDPALQDEGDTVKVMEKMDATSYRLQSTSLRVRNGVMGFLENYKDVFLGNPYRYAIEVSGIYHLRPMDLGPLNSLQLELSATVDFGKHSGDKSVRGRYVTALLRCNSFCSWPIRDMRPYLGLGATLINVERVKDWVAGRIVFGYTATGGFEIPLSRYVYFDINLQYMQPASPVRLGSADPSDFKDGSITSLGLGAGLGLRLK